jgi:TfoX/Sxy family transcriptional regulator of competence genes
MAYDPDLAQRVRVAVHTHATRRGLRTDERKMFGGLAFMVEGTMACGVVGQELMARVGASRHAQALARPHTRPMDFTGRPMTGYIFVTPPGCATDYQVDAWIAQALDHVSTLIPARRTTP